MQKRYALQSLRLAAALRENLRRRKAQLREMGDAEKVEKDGD